MVYYDFVLIQNIKKFIRKHKILCLFIFIFFIYSFKKCFCIEYLADSYPDMDFSAYVTYDATTETYKRIGDNNVSYCTDYCIMYSTQYNHFNIMFFPEGLYFNNSYGKGRPTFPTNTWDTSLGVPANSYNYINIEYNANGSFNHFVNYSRQAFFSGWWEYIVYSTCTINNQSGTPIILEPDPTRLPSFLNSSSDFVSLDFDNLRIDPGTFDTTLNFRLIDTTENRRLIDIYFINGEYDDFMEREDLSNPFSNLIYSIPLEYLPSFNYIKDHTYRWQLIYGETGSQQYINVDITATVSANVNEVTNGDIQNSINETNDKIDTTNQELSDLNDNLTNSDVNSVSSSDLPSISVTDSTSSGIDSIFTSLYNAFCSGNAQDIVLPIPHTNKSITIQPYYIQNMLNNHNASWVLLFIQAFWGYLFGRFIIKDIASKIRKIKSGNIEGLQNSNIKEEML